MRNILIVFAFLLFSQISKGQTDNCDNTAGGQLTVNTSCTTTNFNSNNSTDYWNSASGCGATDVDDAWGWFVATGTTTTITYNSSNDAILTLFGSTCSTGMAQLACSNSTSTGNETITYATTIGSTYHIRIQRNGSDQNMSGTICVWSPAVTPCSSSTTIAGCGSTFPQTYNNSGTGVWYTSSSNPCGFYSEGVEKIYSFTPTSTGLYNIVVTAASGGYIDYLYQAGSCASTGWTCIDDISTTGTFGSLSLVAGTTYYFLLDPEDITAMSQTFYLSCPLPPPSNDECANAITLTPTMGCTYSTYTLIGATASSVSQPTCGSYSSSPDVWFKFTVPASGNYVVDVNGDANIDEVFGLYTGTCGGLTFLATPGCVDYPPTGILTGTPGSTIYIRVWDYADGADGGFDICVYEPCNSPTSITAIATPAGPITTPTSITFSATQTGGVCPGTWEYQWETSTGTVLQAWSSTATYTATISADVSYRVKMRCSSCNTTSTTSNTVSVNYLTPPANDECANAITLTPTLGCTYSTYTLVDATASSVSQPTCGSYSNSPDVWFKFTIPASGNYAVDVNGDANIDEVFGLYSGNCGGLTFLATPGCVDYPPTGVLTGTPGSTIYIRVWDYFDGADGGFDICVYEPCNAPTTITTSVSPAGPISTPTSVTFNVASSTGGACTGNWEYQWETTSGTVLQAWSTTSSYTATINSTQNLHVMMRCSSCPTNTNSGTASIMFVNAMTNNECSVATPLIVGSSCNYSTYQLNSSTASANNQPTCGSYSSSPDVWFSFTVPASGNYVVDVNGGTGMDEVFCLYSGLNCSSLTYLTTPGCVDSPPTSTLSGTPGETIWVRVWEYYEDATGTFDICVREVAATTFTSGQDCELGYTVCNDQEFTGNSSGGGADELDATNQGCLSTEHESSWYLFSPQSAGIIELAITPDVWADDYDFAIWGPFPEGSMASDVCPPTGTPLRCSYSAADGTTGLVDSVAVTDDTESASGDKWVNEIIVTPSDVNSVYILLLDNYSATTEPFTLNWSLTDVVLDCTVLPVVLLNASAECNNEGVLLTWNTVSETNNSHFVILRDNGSGDFEEIGIVSGAGNSNMKQAYTFNDNYRSEGTVYYRLDQVDFDGKQTTLKIMPVDCYHLSGFKINNASLDASSGNLEINFEGFANNEYQINLMDLSGKVIFSDSFIAANDGKNQSISYFKPVAQGVYVVSLTNKSGITKFSKVSPR